MLGAGHVIVAMIVTEQLIEQVIVATIVTEQLIERVKVGHQVTPANSATSGACSGLVRSSPRSIAACMRH